MTLKRKSSISKKGKSSLNPLSAEKAKARYKYLQVCKEIDLEMLCNNDCIYCTSCEETVAGWTVVVKSWGHSHNLPKGRFQEYEAERWNISPRCQGENGCHEALDSCNFERIKDFKDLEAIMNARAEYAPEEYNKFVTGLREVGCNDYEYINIEKS